MRKRKPTNVSLDAALVAEARALGISLSQEFERHLEQVVRQRRRDVWLEENREAFEAYGRFVEKHGIWNEDEREW